MIQGIAFALSACLFWGLIFVVPQFLDSFSSVEVALGRYFFYAIISITIFARARLKGFCQYGRPIWFKALYFSLASTMVYYTALVLALRCCAPAICALVLGQARLQLLFMGIGRTRNAATEA